MNRQKSHFIQLHHVRNVQDLGFAVMESFMDKLSVKSVVGKGTVVTMRKKLGESDE